MGDVVIKEEDIDKWRAEKAELEDSVKKLDAKLKAINRKLEALALLTRNEKKAKSVTEKAAPLPADVIYSVLANAKKTLSPKQIREKVIETGFPKERWGQNFAYFYTTLKRLVDEDKIQKTDDGDYFVPPESVLELGKKEA